MMRSEFELPELRTTVMVPQSLLPSVGITKNIPTNWKAPSESGPMANVAAYCRRRSGQHTKVAAYCQKHSSGHTHVSPIGPEGTPIYDSEINLEPGSAIARVVLEIQPWVVAAAA